MAEDEATPVVMRPYRRGSFNESGSNLAIERWNGDKEGLFVEKNRERKKKKDDWKGKSGGGKCHFCGKPGHWRRDCPDYKRKTGDASTSIAMEKIVSDNLLTAVVSDVSDRWVLDTGASHHMTPHRDYFSSFVSEEGKEILMGNGTSCRVKGKGTVRIRMYDGVVRTLTGVHFVPGLRKSLISLGQLSSVGCNVTMEKSSLRVSRGALDLMKGVMVHNLYLLEGTTVLEDSKGIGQVGVLDKAKNGSLEVALHGSKETVVETHALRTAVFGRCLNCVRLSKN